MRCSQAKPAAASADGVAAMLGREVGGEVLADDLAWEPSSGWLYDAFLGRRVLFIAKTPGPDGPQRDAYRASVQVSREGRAIRVVLTRKLSDTPLADEGPLVLAPDRVAYASRHRGRVTGFTLLLLDQYACQECSLAERAEYAVANYFEYGSPRTQLRNAIALDQPAREASIDLTQPVLAVVSTPNEQQVFSVYGLIVNRRGPARTGIDGWQVPQERPWPHDRAKAWLRENARTVATALAKPWRRGDRRDASANLPWGLPDHQAKDPLQETADTPDPNRSGPIVRLVAIDTRRFELRIQAGYHHPHALTGPGGSGKIPDHDLPRLAAILGASGEGGGMLVNERVLLPPRDGLATVAIDRRGRALFGRWRDGDRVPSTLVALRQSEVPPNHAGKRAGLCRTGAGQLVYGWSERVTPAELARVLERAGCVEQVPLALTAAPLQLVGRDDPLREHGIRRAADFFYLLARDRPATGRLALEPALGEQPPPTWLPAIHRAVTERHGSRITLWWFAANRFDWLIRAGHGEARGRTADNDLAPAERARALIAIGLGSSDPDNRRGLTVAGTTMNPFREDHGALITGDALSLALASDGMIEPNDAAELVVLAEASKLRSEARHIGAPRMRSALCVAGDGSLLYAQGVFDNPEPVAEVLLEAGCRRIVDTDRGRQPHAFIHQAGSETPLQAEYFDTVLYGLAAAAHGTARPLHDE